MQKTRDITIEAVPTRVPTSRTETSRSRERTLHEAVRTLSKLRILNILGLRARNRNGECQL